MATAAAMCRPHASASAQARSWKPGRRRQGCGRLANASPVRDERIANLSSAVCEAETPVASMVTIQCITILEEK